MLRSLLILFVVLMAETTFAQQKAVISGGKELMHKYTVPQIMDTLSQRNVPYSYFIAPGRAYNVGHLLVVKVPTDYNGLIVVQPVPENYNGTLLIKKLGKQNDKSFVKPMPQKDNPLIWEPEKGDKP